MTPESEETNAFIDKLIDLINASNVTNTTVLNACIWVAALVAFKNGKDVDFFVEGSRALFEHFSKAKMS